MIFDTHAHYDDRRFSEDQEAVLLSMKNNNVGMIVNVAAEYPSFGANISLCEKYNFIYGTIGLHPDGVSILEESNNPAEILDEMKSIILGNNKIVAVGEIGLDYYYEDPSRDIQKRWFIEQMRLAEEVHKPVIIHSRDAANDTLDILKQFPKVTGVMHCYSYTKETAEKLIDMGYVIGVGGVVTFKNARKLVETVEYLPLNKIILETDCPYMAPEPLRGSRNDSSLIKYVIKKIAEIKNISEEEVEKITWANACTFYGINL